MGKMKNKKWLTACCFLVGVGIGLIGLQEICHYFFKQEVNELGLVVSTFIIIGTAVALAWSSYKESLERWKAALLLTFLPIGVMFGEEYSPIWELVLTLVAFIFLGIALYSYIIDKGGRK